MAGHTANAVVHVDAVIKEDKIGRPVDAIPRQSSVIGQAIPEGRQHRRLFPNLRMARHTGFSGRQTGKGRFLDACVAVTAVESQPENVMFVAEGHRLFQRYHLKRCPRRPINRIGNSNAGANQKHHHRETRARDCVGPRTKNLRHIIELITALPPAGDLAVSVPVEIF